ncbi:DNA polymerase Y family protein [Fonticella tunisiensis]|uniref:DNA polymerase IV n=1 Tax=Fonticella tunisiensis TaxID=1096341 RepID=A0A4R7KAF6_9CLOT|nr:DNA polymerase IV [Fonticella tunisiensis]TDT51354.1 DNA polymerase-4 [Fonticella tunisiensis]
MVSSNRIIFHIDVNSAYLSWTSVYNLQHGDTLDLRMVPSVVGGDPRSRHGIVLAKSIPAKKYGIQTGEPLFSARQKCRDLIIVPPMYDLYIRSSNAMVEILREYTPYIQRFSIDECFLDFAGTENIYKDYIELAYKIKDRIREDLGFTVNVGISTNKLLAKVASDLEKPDKVHTLFPHEIREKMWPLPVENLFMVGRATLPKLNKMNIYTIGDLANHDVEILKASLKSHGVLIWNYANGIEDSEVRSCNLPEVKGVGNSTTTSFDVADRKTAHMVLLSLVETASMRLRNLGNCCRLVSVSLKTSSFVNYSHQRKLLTPTNSTRKIAETAYNLFDEIWRGEPIRHLGVYLSELCSSEFYQISFLDDEDTEKSSRLDKAIDAIRLKYGPKAVMRSVFLHSGLKPMMGGVTEDDYPVMTSML